MFIRKFHIILPILILCFTSTLVACSPTAATTSAGPVTFKVAVLPILDTLPMYVAQQENLFAKYNINIEFIPVASAAEREQVIVAGQVDGMVNEALSTAFYNKDQTQVQIVRFAQIATPEQTLFRILVAKDSEVTDADGL